MLLEPIMQVTVTVPEDAVGDVIGDLNSRRGRPHGMEPVGAGMTEVKAEVPMAEMLTYAPDLRSITGGQGEFTMEFLRYEEVPGAPGRQGGRGGQGRKGGCQGVSQSVQSKRRWGASATKDIRPSTAYSDLRRVRSHAAARRAIRGLHRRWRSPRGVRALQAARAPRGVGPGRDGSDLRRIAKRALTAARHAPEPPAPASGAREPGRGVR